MVIEKFYKNWKNITNLEKKAITSLNKAKRIILKNIPKEEIIAIYVKGSLVTREMNKKSDVDTLTILKHSKYLQKLQTLENRYRHKFDPIIQIVGYSLWELKTGKRVKIKGKEIRASPTRAITHFDRYKLIHGKEINANNLEKGSKEKRLIGMVGAFNNIFLPAYGKEKIGFREINKQIRWLVENERAYLGKETPHSFRELDKSIKDKNHIIHNTFIYNLSKPADKKIRATHIKKLRAYLKELDKLLKN